MHAKDRLSSRAETCACQQCCKHSSRFSILGSLSLTDIKVNYRNRKLEARGGDTETADRQTEAAGRGGTREDDSGERARDTVAASPACSGEGSLGPQTKWLRLQLWEAEQTVLTRKKQVGPKSNSFGENYFEALLF